MNGIRARVSYLAIALGLASLVAFLWALRSGQYEDLEGAGERILDDELMEPAPTHGAKRQQG